MLEFVSECHEMYVIKTSLLVRKVFEIFFTSVHERNLLDLDDIDEFVLRL